MSIKWARGRSEFDEINNIANIQSLRETRLYSNTLLRRFCERVTRDGIDCIGLRYICHIIRITTFEKFVSYTLRLRGHSKQNLLHDHVASLRASKFTQWKIGSRTTFCKTNLFLSFCIITTKIHHSTATINVIFQRPCRNYVSRTVTAGRDSFALIWLFAISMSWLSHLLYFLSANAMALATEDCWIASALTEI